MNNYHMETGDIPQKLNFPLRLSSFGFYNDATGIYNGKRPDNIEFVLRISSPEKYAIDVFDGVEYRNNFPHVLIRLPRVVQQMKSFVPRKVFYMIFDASMYDIMLEAGIRFEPLCWPMTINPECQSVIVEMSHLAENIYSPHAVDRANSLALRLLHEFMFQRQYADYENDDFHSMKMDKIASYLRRHYLENITLEDIPAMFGLSRRSFFRHWSQRFKQSPKQYLIDLKMREAARQLEYNRQVSSIAAQLNFNDFSYFCEQFKCYYGITPLQYRNKYLKINHRSIPS